MVSEKLNPFNTVGLKNIFRSLKYRNYRLFFSGQGISLIGTWMQRIAMPWLVYKITGSVFLLGVVGFAGQIPTFLLAPVAGVLTDRWNRYHVLIVTQIFAIFGIAMAHLEGVVVVYLRENLGITNSESNKESLEKFPKRDILIEESRELATIIMIMVIAFLTGLNWPEKIIFFLWTFAFWDLFYYLSLYILIKWPPTLKTIDVLFLIPRPWISPVWFPIGISLFTIIGIAVMHMFSIF